MKFRITRYLPLILLFLCLAAACRKVDDFKNTLDALPQVSNQTKYAYKPSYVVGDTMTIVGRLQPNNGLKIHIGNADAPIVASDTLHYRPNPTDSAHKVMDWVKVIIAENMGSGQNIPVKITSGGYSTNGANISIYSQFGADSFKGALKIVDHAEMTDPSNIFLLCINGKGDLYFYETPSGSLKHIKKDGTTETLLTKDQLTNNQYTIQSFITGGVNPQGTEAWLSIQTPDGYAFVETDFVRKSVKVLNKTTKYAAPYVGNVGQVNLQVTSGIYPDSKGNVILTTPGFLFGWLYTDCASIARYSSADGKLDYLFKSEASPKEVPGISFEGGATPIVLPDENLMYIPVSNGIKLYDLQSRISIKNINILPEQYGALPKSYIGPFNNLKINFGGAIGSSNQPNAAFGFLPKPGKKLIFLLYQYLDGQIIGTPQKDISALVNGPKWITFDFNEDRSYQYASGPADLTGYSFEPYSTAGKPASIFKDEMLNYDEDGHLYMTANGRKKIVKTAIK